MLCIPIQGRDLEDMARISGRDLRPEICSEDLASDDLR